MGATASTRKRREDTEGGLLTEGRDMTWITTRRD